MQAIFLDTPIQIERLLSTSNRVHQIQLNLRNKRIYTSSIVYMEFKRTILQDIRYVHALISANSTQPNNKLLRVSDIDRWLASSKGNFSARSRDRCKLVTAAIKDEFPERYVALSKILMFLDELISTLNYYFFHISLDQQSYFELRDEHTYIDKAGCVLSSIAVLPGDLLNNRLACRADKTECHLHHFLSFHANELHAIHDTLSTLPKQQRDEKAFIALTNVLTNGYHQALGERHCWALGDIIIALETPLDAAIYTSNRKHFQPLCDALGKHLYNEI